jgi:hypothetical protein
MRHLAAFASVLLAVGAACSGGGSPGSPPAPGETVGGGAQPVTRFSGDWPRTDFSRTGVDLAEVIRGCPARDCIPALDAEGAVEVPGSRYGTARFEPVAGQYEPQLPVAYVVVEGKAKAYPLHILTWHEIVNDREGDTWFAVTFCPLCNTALSFNRTLEGRTYDFGVSGLLRHSDLIMWDRQTESWWQQATGEAIVGELAGKRLEFIATSIVSFGDFARAFPGGWVLTEETGIGRPYGVNPYDGYDARGSFPFLFGGSADPRRPALERVVGLGSGRAAIAVPFDVLAKERLVNLALEGKRIVVLWAPGTASALDRAEIAASADIGAAVAYSASVGGRDLTFRPVEPGLFRDNETGSTWQVTGLAVGGPLAGERLPVAQHANHFWFAWAAFNPETSIWEP